MYGPVTFTAAGWNADPIVVFVDRIVRDYIDRPARLEDLIVRKPYIPLELRATPWPWLPVSSPQSEGAKPEAVRPPPRSGCVALGIKRYRLRRRRRRRRRS